MEKVSIITVVFNDVNNIAKTIESIINQTYIETEFIIIDGLSTDGTLDIISKYKDRIDLLISEQDNGIYDAMNKAIRNASGEWLIFMNSGDTFYNDNVLEDVFKKTFPADVNLIYSDFYIGKELTKASFEKGIILHQAVIYRKCTHNNYGYYQITHKYIISDYMFFMRFKCSEVYKTDTVIARNDIAGISGGRWCLFQKLCCDYIYDKISLTTLLLKIIYWNIKFLIRR